MFTQIALGFAWTCLSIAIAVVSIIALIEAVDLLKAMLRRLHRIVRDAIILSLAVIWMMAVIVLITFMWAGLFLWLGTFTDLSASFYFAIVSLTTVGFGDVILPDEWRILSGFAAADGFIIFGLDTAVLFEILRRLREAEAVGERLS